MSKPPSAGGRSAMLRWIRWSWYIACLLWCWAVWELFISGPYLNALGFVLGPLGVYVGMRAVGVMGISVSKSRRELCYRGPLWSRSIPLDQLISIDTMDVNIFSGIESGFVQLNLSGRPSKTLWGLGYADPDTHGLLLAEIERLSRELWGWVPPPRIQLSARRASGTVGGTVGDESASISEIFWSDIFGGKPWSGNVVRE